MSLQGTLLDAVPGAAEWPAPCPGGSAIPMQTHAWMHARTALLAQPSSLRIYAVRNGDAIEALAPFVRVGEWLREPPMMFEPSDLVWSTPESLRELAAILAGQPLPVCLDRVPVGSATIPALRRAYSGRGVVLVGAAMPTPVIELGVPSHVVDSCLNAGRRSDLRRAERRARGLGTVDFELHSPAREGELAPLIDEAYAVEARSWKARTGTALTADAWQGAFIRRFARCAAQEGILRIAFLRIDGQAAAMQIAAQWQRRFWLFKISYDLAFSHCSPGQLLMLHTLRHAARTGLLSYEFMGLMDDWTKQWTRQARQYVQIRAFPFSAATGRMLVRRGARSIAGRLRRFTR